MKRIVFAPIAVAALAVVIVATAGTTGPVDGAAAAISEGKLPPGYRDWKFDLRGP